MKTTKLFVIALNTDRLSRCPISKNSAIVRYFYEAKSQGFPIHFSCKALCSASDNYLCLWIITGKLFNLLSNGLPFFPRYLIQSIQQHQRSSLTQHQIELLSWITASTALDTVPVNKRAIRPSSTKSCSLIKTGTLLACRFPALHSVTTRVL